MSGPTAGQPHTITEHNQTLTGFLADGTAVRFGLITSGGGIGDSIATDATLIVTLLQPQPGDFDFDGDVDGVDFLVWQCDGADPGAFADWQSHYGTGATSLVGSAANVPEPGTTALL
jgi:hypothetical protein